MASSSSSPNSGVSPATDESVPKKTGTVGYISLAMTMLSVAALLVALVLFPGRAPVSGAGAPSALPSQAVWVAPKSFAVLNATDPRNDTTPFNPTGTASPYFQVFDERFLDILGPNASIHRVASHPGFAFAHEAPIYYEPLDQLFFTSNDGSALGFANWNNNSHYGFISLTEVSQALAAQNWQGDVSVDITELDLPYSVQMVNGGTGPYYGSLVLITSGRGNLPPSVVLVNPEPPYNTTVLLDNYYGRNFNSLNDAKIHDGKIFFTDVTYGVLQDFRPTPELPNQVYRLDPITGSLRVVADQFDKCNGIAFDGAGTTAYVTDTGSQNGFGLPNSTEPSTIYAYDVSPGNHFFTNRRVFAYADTGIPDGINVDTNGNVYSGTGEGVSVWAPDGTLLGKFFIDTTSSNFAFAGPGRILLLAETEIYQANIAATGVKVSYP